MRQALASLVLLVAAVLLSTCAFIERDVWIEHVVVLSERHFIRLVRSYTSYYHEERCRLGLHKDTPNERAATPRPSSTARVVALPRVGGLHHRYEWREAA